MKTLKKTILQKLSIAYLILIAVVLVSSCGKKKSVPAHSLNNHHLSDTTKTYYVTISDSKVVDTAPSKFDFSIDNKEMADDNTRNPNYGMVTGQGGDTNSHVNIVDSTYASVTKASVLKTFEVAENLSDIATKIENKAIKYTDWGIYNRNSHVITPDTSKTIIILQPNATAANSKLYKLRVISIYKDAPANPTQDSKKIYLTVDWAELTK